MKRVLFVCIENSNRSQMAENLMAYVGCIAGAILVDDYHAWLKAAGFAVIQIIDSCVDLVLTRKLKVNPAVVPRL